jgi:hypothetical protein
VWRRDGTQQARLRAIGQVMHEAYRGLDLTPRSGGPARPA